MKTTQEEWLRARRRLKDRFLLPTSDWSDRDWKEQRRIEAGIPLGKSLPTTPSAPPLSPSFGHLNDKPRKPSQSLRVDVLLADLGIVPKGER